MPSEGDTARRTGSEDRRVVAIGGRPDPIDLPPIAADAGNARRAEEQIAFGPFVLSLARRTLERDGQPVSLGGRSFDILHLLVERAGQVVGKEEIIARVWPGIATVEGNLRVQISGLRKSLRDGQDGQRYIINVSNRGYSFIVPVRRAVAKAAPLPVVDAAPSARHNIPVVQGRVIGRKQASLALMERVLDHRLVTLVGAGGVGKTTLALSTMPLLLERRETAAWQGAFFVDLSSLSDPHLVPSTIAMVLGIEAVADNSLNGVVAYLVDKELLLLIDNCEHLASEVVHVCEAILGNAPKVRILATSREPLRIEGERIQTLRPLAIPAEGLSAAQAITYSAVELFVERARARTGTFTLRDDLIDAVVGICRRLDGIPLAIEMASARVDCLGVSGLATALDAMFSVLTKGRRTALPRHQTLYAAIDWSFNLLSPRDQTVLRRLSVFPGAFTIEAAAAVATCDEHNISDVVESLCDLVDRSLVTSDVNRSDTYFRLLETTRAYARGKLRDGPEMSATVKMHAEYCLEALGEAELARARNDLAAWQCTFGWLIDDIRAALDWAFSSRGDGQLGLSLTFAALPLWFHQSSMAECGGRIQQALSVLETAGPGHDLAAAKLHTARACVLGATPGRAEEAEAAWTIAYELAAGLEDADYMLRNLWGLWAAKMIDADFQAARGFADRFCRLAGKSSDSSDCAIGQRLLAASLHFLGDQEGALRHVDEMLARYRAPLRRAHVARYQFDQVITACIARSRTLWVLGRGDEALRALDASVDDALAIGHKLTLCNTLMQAACPVALLAGDLERAERFTELLRQESERNSLGVWQLFAGCFQGQVLVQRGDLREGLPLIRAAIENQQLARQLQYSVSFHVSYADGLAANGEIEEARTVLDKTLARAASNSEHWVVPELLRLKGEIEVRAGSPPANAEAERLFAQSLELATRQKALSWQLRTATSLARLRRMQGRSAEGRELLASTYGAFSEGHGLRDLVVAKSLLGDLGR